MPERGQQFLLLGQADPFLGERLRSVLLFLMFVCVPLGNAGAVERGGILFENSVWPARRVKHYYAKIVNFHRKIV